MPDVILTAEFVLRGMAIGALAATGVALFRAGANSSMRIAGSLFTLSTIAYVVNSSHVLRSMLGVYDAPLTLLSLGGGGYFWLFVITLFQDRPISLQTLAPAALLTVVGIAGIATEPPVRNGVWIVHNLIEIALSVHALYVIYDSWRGDLVEARRRLRGPFLGVVSVYTIAMSGIEIGESVGVEAWWYSLVGGGVMALFCLAGSFVFLEARTAIFGRAAPAAATAAPIDAPRIDPADRMTLEKLAEAMDKGQVWKDETLTIGSLAEKVGVPEHRLRRLINDNLGHRNFAAFVNTRRIEAAKQTLADPAQARTTVAAIAFDLGFGSLGPFNRAFKEATGKTPTQWRRDALDNASPKPEIAS
ncbi:MAG: helix-turn-helix domain-containing protein [Alphaproteobacteria bacterium]|nr:helix-turn-helix domain-containing protein [Alphaproteobacteria bacterium]